MGVPRPSPSSSASSLSSSRLAPCAAAAACPCKRLRAPGCEVGVGTGVSVVEPGVLLLDGCGLRCCCCEGVWARAAEPGGRGAVLAACGVAAVGCGEGCWRGEVAGCGSGKDWSSPPVLSRRAQSGGNKKEGRRKKEEGSRKLRCQSTGEAGDIRRVVQCSRSRGDSCCQACCCQDQWCCGARYGVSLLWEAAGGRAGEGMWALTGCKV